MYGNYMKHLEEALQYRDHHNFFLLHYEELKNNTKNEIQRLNNFLDISLTNQQVDKVIEIYEVEPIILLRKKLKLTLIFFINCL